MMTENQWKILVWSLEELADKPLQEKLWLSKIPNQMSSFIEAMCGVFDDSGLSLALDSAKSNLPDDIRQKATLLKKLIRKLPSLHETKVLIDHPAMTTVRTAAADLLASVRQHKPHILD